MTDRELMRQALDALINAKGYIFHNVLDDTSNRYDIAIEALRARLSQPEPEPLWIRNEEGKLELHAPPHFIDPAKVARLMDEAFERGKKEIDMEQVKDIAQKLADCALLNSAPPQREWQGLTDETEIKHLWYEACQTNLELTSQLIVHLARNIEAKLKEKNT